MSVIVGAVTVTVYVAERPDADAVMIAVPAAIAVTPDRVRRDVREVHAGSDRGDEPRTVDGGDR